MVFYADDRADPKDDVVLVCNKCVDSQIQGPSLVEALAEARRRGWKLGILTNYDVCWDCCFRRLGRRQPISILAWLGIR